MKEGCHLQQMLREQGIAAAISTFLLLSRGDRKGADPGGPEWIHAEPSDTCAEKEQHIYEHAPSVGRDRADVTYPVVTYPVRSTGPCVCSCQTSLV